MPYLASTVENGFIEVVEREDEPYVPPSEDFIRSHRDMLLKESDWTQVADAPVDQAAWATYRQALRDVPQQAGFPHEVDWPAKP